MAHRSRLAGFIIDCQTGDLDAAADVLEPGAGPAHRRPRRRRRPGSYALFGDTPGGLHIEVQKVDHPSRVHLDIEADDVDAEAARLEKLGAKKIGFVKRWWVMEAPTGQRFCVVTMQHAERRERGPNDWD